MIEIKRIDQAKHLYECYFVPTEGLESKVNEIAESMLRALESGKIFWGAVCSHYGGNYWFHFGEKSEALSYFCNVPPGPSGFYFGGVIKEKHYETALKFLVERNAFFKRALDYLRNKIE